MVDKNHSVAASHQQLSHIKFTAYINLFVQAGPELEKWEVPGLDTGFPIHGATAPPNILSVQLTNTLT